MRRSSRDVRFPDERFSVVSLCNLSTSNPSELTRRVADVFLADRLGPAEARATDDRPAVTVGEKELAHYAGLYWLRGTDNFRKISLKDGALRVGFGDTPAALKAVAANRFAGRTSDLLFEPEPPGRIRLTELGRSAVSSSRRRRSSR